MAVTFSFRGSVLPRRPPLTLGTTPTVLSEVLGGNPATMTLAVADGQFEVNITVATFDEETWQGLFGPASDYVRARIEAKGLLEGVPYTGIIETLVRPDGVERPVALGQPELALLHSFDSDDEQRITELLLNDFPLSQAVSDLLMMLSRTHYSPISCGRVADSLARLIAPGAAPATAWAQLRATLNVDEAYVKLLTDNGRGPRHGDRQVIPATVTQELARRAWTLMSRYLRFRLDGRLNPHDYPLLNG